jgi:hypothetical protein
VITLLRRRLRYMVLGRLIGGDPRRWLLYFAATAGLRTFRKYLRGSPETVYVGRLRPEERLDLLTTRPLPARFATRKVRKAVRDDARAELGG